MFMTKAYTTVSVPDELIATVERLIANRTDLAYRNRSEFIIEAIREKVSSLELRDR
jgi:metal-responsive CopG/Arc/MetJ family transcriptional regulator